MVLAPLGEPIASTISPEGCRSRWVPQGSKDHSSPRSGWSGEGPPGVRLPTPGPRPPAAQNEFLFFEPAAQKQIATGAVFGPRRRSTGPGAARERPGTKDRPRGKGSRPRGGPRHIYKKRHRTFGEQTPRTPDGRDLLDPRPRKSRPPLTKSRKKHDGCFSPSLASGPRDRQKTDPGRKTGPREVVEKSGGARIEKSRHPMSWTRPSVRRT